MFIKPFKLKSNIQLKGSEKKKLKAKLLSLYKTVNDGELQTILSNKSTVNAVKIVTLVNEQEVVVYTVDKRPMFFETVEDKILPTVYALWVLPNLVPILTTHVDVLPKLANGADLMLPGVIRQSANDLQSWGNYKKNDIFGINLASNKSAIAVGYLANSSYDLYMCGGRGIAINVCHVFGDKLWGMEPSMCLQPPVKGNISAPEQKNYTTDFPELGSEKTEPVTVNNSENLQLDQLEINDKHVQAELNPDDVVKEAFLNSLKLHGKKLNLPLLTSTFYPQYVQPSSSVEIKKTSYKKVGVFLKSMANEGFITIKEEPKGVEKIISVNTDHPEVMKFIPKKQEKRTDENLEETPQLLLTKMTEVFIVTEKSKMLFSNFNHEVGRKLDEKQIKDHVKDYVSRKHLLDKSINKINMDDVLMEASDREGTISMDSLISAVRSNMDATFEMRTQDKILTKHGKKPIVHLTTAKRTGNKSVTIITNLAEFGINIAQLSKAIKLGVAASTCMTEVPGYKTEQLLVQGNQIQFVHDLLTQTYNIPRGSITGLEFAKKDKKKK